MGARGGGTVLHELLPATACFASVLALAEVYLPLKLLAVAISLVWLRSAVSPALASLALRLRRPPPRDTGGACRFQLLDDDTALLVLVHLDAPDLELVACCSTRLRRLSRDEGIWRTQFLRRYATTFHALPVELSCAPRQPPFKTLLLHVSRLRRAPQWWTPDDGKAGEAPAPRAPQPASRASRHSGPGAPRPPRAPRGRRSLAPPSVHAGDQLGSSSFDEDTFRRAAAVEAHSGGGTGRWRAYYYLYGHVWRRIAVAGHSKPDDCWLVVDSRVLDVTHFLDRHPGERGALLLFAGLDATEAFHATQHSYADPYFPSLLVPHLDVPPEGMPAAFRGALQLPLRSSRSVRARRTSSMEVRELLAGQPAPVAEPPADMAVPTPARRSVWALLGATVCGLLASFTEVFGGRFALVAWADDPRNRHLSYHDFLDMRPRPAANL